MNEKLYWHLVRPALDGLPRLGYNDNRQVIVGETLSVRDEPVLCYRGLHACAHLFDTFTNICQFPFFICRVSLGGTVRHTTDKSVATERTCIAMLQPDKSKEIVRGWERWCVLQVAHLWNMPYGVKRYLETGDETIHEGARIAMLGIMNPKARFTGVAYLAAMAAWCVIDNSVDSYVNSTAIRNAARARAKSLRQEVAYADSKDIARKFSEELERRVLRAMRLSD